MDSGATARISSHFGATRMRVKASTRVNAGAVYTILHHAVSQVNQLIADQSDWADGSPLSRARTA